MPESRDTPAYYWGDNSADKHNPPNKIAEASLGGVDTKHSFIFSARQFALLFTEVRCLEWRAQRVVLCRSKLVLQEQLALVVPGLQAQHRLAEFPARPVRLQLERLEFRVVRALRGLRVAQGFAPRLILRLIRLPAAAALPG